MHTNDTLNKVKSNLRNTNTLPRINKNKTNERKKKRIKICWEWLNENQIEFI